MSEHSAKSRKYKKCLGKCERDIKNNNDKESNEALGKCKIDCMKKLIYSR